MERREMLGALGAGAVGVALTARGAPGQQTGGAGGRHGDIHDRCAEACSDCEKECNVGFHHCFKLAQDGKQSHAKAMHLCVDCGDICSTSAKLVARKSPLMAFTCRACAESCEACIEECEKMNDPEMKRVVASLRACRESCLEMVKAMGSREGAR